MENCAPGTRIVASRIPRIAKITENGSFRRWNSRSRFRRGVFYNGPSFVRDSSVFVRERGFVRNAPYVYYRGRGPWRRDARRFPVLARTREISAIAPRGRVSISIYVSQALIYRGDIVATVWKADQHPPAEVETPLVTNAAIKYPLLPPTVPAVPCPARSLSCLSRAIESTSVTGARMNCGTFLISVY